MIDVCYVAGYGDKLAGSERSLLNLMDVLVPKGLVRPHVVLQSECDLVRELERRGIEYIILKSMDSFGGNGFPLDQKNWLINHASIPAAYRYLRNKGIRIVHMNNSYAPIAVPFAARLAGVPYAWHFREHPANYSFVSPKESRRLMSKAGYRIAISDDIARSWTKFLDAGCTTVLNGVPLAEYYNAGSCLFGDGDKGTLRLLIMGRVKESKGQLDAVLAVKELVARGRDDVCLDIVGASNTEYEAKLRETIRRERLEGRITLVPFSDESSLFRSRCNVGLLCSEAEAFGRVTVEYMLAGLLAVGTNTGGTPEIIEDGITGLLYAPGDYRGLADKLEWVLDNKLLAQRIACEGQRSAMERFNIERTASEVYELYVDLLKGMQMRGGQ